MERGWTLLVLGTLCLSAFMHTCAATTTTAISSTVTAGAVVGGGGNTGSGGCTDNFVRTADSGRQGAVRIITGTGFFTQALCQSECLTLSRAACAGYDWATTNGNPTGQRACWISTEANSAMNGITARPNEGIDTYTRVACDSQTTTPTSTPAVGQCTDTFAMTANANFLGGVATAAAGNTVTTCTAYCLNAATCTGFDFVPATGTCWIISTTTFTPGGNGAGVNHYRRVACNDTVTGPTGCVDTFREDRAMQLFRGAGRAGLDPVACLAACLAEAFCTHYEINSNNQCFLHFNQTADTPVSNPSQNHILYTRIPCLTSSTPTGVCRDNFIPRSNTNVFGGVPRPGITTQEACVSLCLEQSNPTCTAFDFSSFGNLRCYTFTSVTRQYNPSQDVTHYEREFRCNGTVTGPSCVETYSSTADSNRQGGVRQASINTNPGCAAACSSLGVEQVSTACYGYDFNVNSNECYFHIGSISDQTGTFPGVTSYVRGFVCNGATTLGGGCTDVYTPSPNSNVFGGVARPSSNTETLCRAACSATIEGQADYCYGYDFDSNSNACFFILIASYDISPGANGVTHYNRMRSCPGSTVVGCVESYNQTANRNAAGGVDIGAQTVESCGTECAARNTTCYGFDIANGNCWLLLSDYTLNAGAANGVNNYRRLFNCGGATTGGGCVPTYTLRPNLIIYGGVLSAGANTIESCAAACTAETNCVAYNYVRGATSDRCFLILGSVGSENPNNDLDLYVQDNNCASQTTVSVTQCRMELLGSGNVNGGTFVPSINSLAACLEWCIGNEPCLAVDWDSTSNQCFWFTTTSTTASGSSCCQHFNKVCENTCLDTFNVTSGIGYFGGMEVLNRPTVMDCQTACIERELCAGFDFNTERGECFTLTLASFERSYSFAGVSNYRRIRCPGGTAGRTTLPTTLRTTSCPDVYTALANSNAPGGARDPTASTVGECQRVCSDNDLCTAFDFASPNCFIHTGIPVVRSGAQGVTHYQRRPCQDPATITPAPFTPAPITPAPTVQCNMDLFILVDAIDGTLLDQMGLIIQQFVYGLNLQNSFVRVSVRSFGSSNTRLFQFATNEEFIVASVSAIRTEQAPNNMPLALQTFLGTEYPTSLALGRQVVLLILSDLRVDNRFFGTLSSLRNQLAAIPTIVVTFNNDLDRNVLNNFSPSVSTLFHTVGRDHFTANDILAQINPLCRSNRNLTPRPSVVTVTPAPPPRQCLGDIAILIDDSGSIRDEASRGGNDNWPLVLQFVANILRSLNIGGSSTRIAIATFSNNASVIYRFIDTQDTNILQERIQLDTIPYTGGNTNLMAGLILLREQIFRPLAGDRSLEPNVVILITDGRPTGGNDNDLQTEIQRLRLVADIIPVGVTDNVDNAVLQQLASNSNNVFNVRDFTQLNSILRRVVDASCNALRR